MKEMDFLLTKEPWILALDLQGQTKLLSLQEVFVQAHQLHGLAGEIAAQDIALLRVLLAVMYATYGLQDTDGPDGPPRDMFDAQRRWQRLWQQGRFPADIMEEYLDIWQERFYLFHPVSPFMQVAIDPNAQVRVDNTSLPINPLIKGLRGFIGDLVESDNKQALFSHRRDSDALGYAEAARWLVHMNSYDVSPLGAPPKGCFRAKGFKIPWPNNLGLVWAQGNNLFETLMLNFVLAPVGQDLWDDFRPAWETEGPFDPQNLTRVEASFPTDPAALFTFPYRYMQLRRNTQGHIEDCVLWGGQLVDTESGNPRVETMTLWRTSKDGKTKPKRHDPSRQIWRDMGPLLSGDQNDPPGIVSWVSGLTNRGFIALPHLQLGIAAVVLSSKSTSVDDAFSDSVRFHTELLSDLNQGWPPRIAGELSVTDDLVRQVRYLAGNLVKAAGGSGEKDPASAGNRASTEAFFRLDAPFRQWLGGLRADSDKEEACRSWRDTQRALFRDIGQDLVRQSGLKALVGRTMHETNGDRVYASPDLYQQYILHINRILSE